MQIGDKVKWLSVNGEKTGEIRFIADGWMDILLPSGKTVIADKRSLKKVEK